MDTFSNRWVRLLKEDLRGEWSPERKKLRLETVRKTSNVLELNLQGRLRQVQMRLVRLTGEQVRAELRTMTHWNPKEKFSLSLEHAGATRSGDGDLLWMLRRSMHWSTVEALLTPMDSKVTIGRERGLTLIELWTTPLYVKTQSRPRWGLADLLSLRKGLERDHQVAFEFPEPDIDKT